MSLPNGLPHLNFAGPATYHVVVQGDLDDSRSDRLAGMCITGETGAQGQKRTTLVGSIRDQAELSGVLETLSGLHLSIIKVEQIDD